MERWYTLWSMGYGQNSYPLDLQEALDTLSNEPLASHHAISADVLGLYVPLGRQTLIGIITNINYDVFKDLDGEIDIFNYISGPSFIHFPNAKIGDGGFIRVDVGTAFYRAKIIFDNEEVYIGSDIGVGVLAGGGWAYPLREGTRLISGVNFAIRRIEKEHFASIGMNLGVLF